MEEILNIIDIELRITFTSNDNTEPMGTVGDLAEAFEFDGSPWFKEAFDAAAVDDRSSATVTSVESIEFIPNPEPGFPVYATVMLIICGIVAFFGLMGAVRRMQQRADAARKEGPVVELTESEDEDEGLTVRGKGLNDEEQFTVGKYLDSRNAKGELVLKYAQTAI